MAEYREVHAERPMVRCECMDRGLIYSGSNWTYDPDGSPDECPDCHLGRRPARTGDWLDVPCDSCGGDPTGAVDPSDFIGCARCENGTIPLTVTLTEDPVPARDGWQVVGTTEVTC